MSQSTNPRETATPSEGPASQNDLTADQRAWQVRHDEREEIQSVRERHQLAREIAQNRREVGQNSREEVQNERERLQEFLLAVLGHDLRSPLFSFAMGMHVLRAAANEGRLTPPEVQLVLQLAATVTRMDRMILQLLDLTRARVHGGLPVQRGSVRLVELIRSLVSSLNVSYPTREFVIDANEDVVGMWDPDRLTQVFANLLENAHRHAPPDTPITVDVRRVPLQAEPAVTVRVHNDGQPIPESLVAVLFDPFQHTTSKSGAGLGLGLFISKLIVEAHGGILVVRSNAAEGTTFEMRLPLDGPANDPTVGGRNGARNGDGS